MQTPNRWRMLASLIIAAFCGALVATIALAQDSVAQSDQAFTPVTPCAIFDTRSGLGGTSGAQPGGSITTFQVANTATCPDVPAGVTVELNLVAVNPQGNGNLRVVAAGGTPGGGVVNYTTGETNSNALAVQTTNNRIDVSVNGSPVHLRGVILGYYTTSLEQRVADLEALLAGLSRETVDGHDTLRLTAANLQLVNGTGTTGSTTSGGAANGTGNLIVGYNLREAEDERTGSHNIVVGNRHSYSANGTVLFGSDNLTSADAAAVTGGVRNQATDFHASVSGGSLGIASGNSASVAGGTSNIASGSVTFVAGGSRNEATSRDAAVFGGFRNQATAEDAAVVGGRDNLAQGQTSTVVGGSSNDASALSASVIGGADNSADGENATVSGGNGNLASGTYSTVSGGDSNIASGEESSVSGGRENEAIGTHSTVSGGRFNDAIGLAASVSGGGENTADGSIATVTGGRNNFASGTHASVSGGRQGTAPGNDDWLAGTLFEDD